jgi:hypothetical protein
MSFHASLSPDVMTPGYILYEDVLVLAAAPSNVNIPINSPGKLIRIWRWDFFGTAIPAIFYVIEIGAANAMIYMSSSVNPSWQVPYGGAPLITTIPGAMLQLTNLAGALSVVTKVWYDHVDP